MKEINSLLPNGNEFAIWQNETVYTRELHVNPNVENASDDNDGRELSPFKSISQAAAVATAKTRVLIHKGVYREFVQPEKGGLGIDSMISYESYGDGDVIVKASVVAEKFELSTQWSLGNKNTSKDIKIWSTEIDPEDYKGYNPFCAVNMIHDREYVDFNKINIPSCLNRRGMVFVDGKPMKQVSLYKDMADEDNTYWVEANGQKIHFRLKCDDSPCNHFIELSRYEQCFAPKKPFLSYIQIVGITFAHASMGAPVPQRGAVSCGRGHHWIIEDCVIDWANTLGIDCGNECWSHSHIPDLLSGNSIIRRNVIKDAGVCGIAAMGSQNLLIEDNLITGVGWQAMELAWESAGIKLHVAKSGLIRRNIIRDCYRCSGLWLDFLNENCRITGNLFLDGTNIREHIFLECSRDSQMMVDNNVIWNAQGRYGHWEEVPNVNSIDWNSPHETTDVNGHGIYIEGTDEVCVANNIIGCCEGSGFFSKPFNFRMAGGRGGTCRDNTFFNNIFYSCGESAIKVPTDHNKSEGNIFAKMPSFGGYLRVLYPEPAMCLDLKAWRKIFGLDMNGALANLEIEVNSEALTMEINVLGDYELPLNPSVKNAECDFYGEPIQCADSRPAGPFADIKLGKMKFSIDPRKGV